MKTKILSILIYWFFAAPLIAQPSQWTITTLTREKGLAHSWVHCAHRDKLGYHWFGTEDGLCRFDGKRVKTFQHEQGKAQSIPRNKVRDIAEAADGNLWLAINGGGLNLFNPHSGRTTTFPTAIHPITHTTAFAGTAVCLDRQGNVWYGSYNNGLYRFDPTAQTFTHFDLADKEGVATNGFQKNTVSDLLLDIAEPNRVWIASNDYRAGLVSINTQTGALVHNAIFGAAMTLMQDEKDCIWVGTWGGGLVRFDISTRRYTAFHPSESEFLAKNWDANVVRGIVRKSATELWIACFDSGLWIFDTQKKMFSRPLGLPTLPNSIFQMTATEPRSIWLLGQHGAVGIREKATLPLRHGVLPHSNCTQYRQSEITDFAYDPLSKKTFVAFGHCDGVFVFDENLVSISNTNPHLDTIKTINALLLDTDRRLWVGGMPTPQNPFSLYFLDMQTLVWSPVRIAALDSFGIHKTQVQDLIQAKDGTIWIGNDQQGLIHFNPKTQAAETPLSKIGFDKSLKINALKESTTGDIWAITETHGLIQYKPTTGQIKHYQHEPIRASSLFETGGNSIEEAADGRIWIGMNHNGIQILDPRKPIDQALESIGLADGLPNLSVVKILRDGQDNLWLSTQNGTCVYNWTTKQIRRFNFGERVEDYTNQGKGFYKNTEGVFFLGGVKDFTVFKPETLLATTASNLPIRFTDVKILGKTIVFDQPLETLERIDIQAHENFITIAFATPDVVDADRIAYRYRLNPNSEWTFCGNQTELTLTNLPDGNTVFEVQSTNEEGIWQPETSRLRLHVIAPFYRTWLFKILVGLLIAALAFAFYNYRIRQIREREALKSSLNQRLAEVKMEALRAQMNPHFIFNCLTSINLYILRKDHEAASLFLSQFAKLIRRVLDQSRSELISLTDDLETLRLFVAMEKKRFGDAFDFQFDIDPHLPTDAIQIPPMLIQPYVENAIWHGLKPKTDGTSLLTIKAIGEETDFTIVVEDNGVGRKKSAATKAASQQSHRSHGLNVTEERIVFANARYNAKAAVEIEDLTDAKGTATGTRITLHFIGAGKDQAVFAPSVKTLF